MDCNAVTVNVCAVPLPQTLEGITVTVPLRVPTVTVTEFDVPPPVCVQSDGKLHVYVVPGTLVTD